MRAPACVPHPQSDLLFLDPTEADYAAFYKWTCRDQEFRVQGTGSLIPSPTFQDFMDCYSRKRGFKATHLSNPTSPPIGHLYLYTAPLQSRDMPDHPHTLFALSIYPPHQSRGFGKAALLWLLREAFDVIRLDSLGLEVKAWNERALKLYKTSGFEQAGVLPGRGKFKGRKMVDLLMVLTRTGYEKLRKDAGET